VPSELFSLVPQPTYALSHITDMFGPEGSWVASGPVATSARWTSREPTEYLR
jgi:hypothetical protein